METNQGQGQTCAREWVVTETGPRSTVQTGLRSGGIQFACGKHQVAMHANISLGPPAAPRPPTASPLGTPLWCPCWATSCRRPRTRRRRCPWTPRRTAFGWCTDGRWGRGPEEGGEASYPGGAGALAGARKSGIKRATHAGSITGRRPAAVATGVSVGPECQRCSGGGHWGPVVNSAAQRWGSFNQGLHETPSKWRLLPSTCVPLPLPSRLPCARPPRPCLTSKPPTHPITCPCQHLGRAHSRPTNPPPGP